MLSSNPYLHFPGNAREAMTFYKSLFGGEFTILSTYGEIAGGEKLPREEQQKLMHVSLVIGNITLMATDLIKAMGNDLVVGNNYHICLHTESEAELERLFAGLTEKGTVEMPPNKTFWGAYFAMCKDQFGMQWMLSFNAEK
jgi:PhnB protein